MNNKAPQGEAELAACPFCGSSAWHDSFGGVKCTNNPRCVEGVDPETWNRRALSPSTPALAQGEEASAMKNIIVAANPYINLRDRLVFEEGALWMKDYLASRPSAPVAQGQGLSEQAALVARKWLSMTTTSGGHISYEDVTLMARALAAPAPQPQAGPSADLADRLESYIPRGDGYNSEYAHDLTAAVEALRGQAGMGVDVEALIQDLEFRAEEAHETDWVIRSHDVRALARQFSAVDADSVPMPQNARQAEMMEKVGYAWLKANAPERLVPIAEGRQLSAAQVPDGWVRVSERLPEPDDPVLVHNGKWTGVGAWCSGDYLEDIERWQDERREFIELIGPAVTHWRPLPLPPAQDQSAPAAGESEQCPDCEGEGETPDLNDCVRCDGKGIIRASHELSQEDSQ